ncbi:MAG: class I SAM-dependent rRNA methyltransferase [Alphaproteobacteria bacterium]|nr:class I SAM-dependent rRNA methyltransferase [Alphaproteobacteria bacterium]
MTLPIVRLQAGRHKRTAQGHPWVYSNEIVMDGAAKALEPGTFVRFYAHDGTYLGAGSFNPHTLIAGRLFTRVPLPAIDKEWIGERLSKALALRQRLVTEPCYRLVHAEADGLPGLIVDRFGPHLSVQINTAGMQRLWPQVEEALAAKLQPESIVLHNDSSVRALEGLDRSVSVARGAVNGPVEVHENGLTYYADIVGGQKTGWYFDQRDNRALVARFAPGARVLDLYCNAGGFGLLAAKAGAAEAIGVDSSEPALDLARKAAVRNKLEAKVNWRCASVFEELEKLNAAKEKFGIVVADPPPFVKSRKDVGSGARGYRKLARLAAQVAEPDGLLFIASCSHNMELNRFTEEVARGLSEARREGRILYTVFAAPDHPVHPHLPESAYLKGLLVQID